MTKNIERVLGAMYGVAVGDALGGPVEFMDADAIARQYGILDTMVGGGWLSLSPGETTDDTAMTLAVAEGIMANPDRPVGPIGENFISWAQSGPKDIGGTCSSAIARASQLLKCGSSTPEEAWREASLEVVHDNGGRSGGNGALMRTAPVGCAYFREADCYLHAREIAEMTHLDEASSEICASYSKAIMLYTRDKGADAEAEVKKLAAMLTRWKAPRAALSPSGWVVDSMECALRAIREADGDTETAIVTAINYGGDADTIGAITGGLIGARKGIDSIPKEWLAALPKDICRRIDTFADFCQNDRS